MKGEKMPGFDSHFVFGKIAFEAMPGGYVKRCCKQYPKSYALGNQGPDSAFFFPVALRNHVKLGEILHTQKCNQFLQNLYLELFRLHGKEAKAIGVAYIAGYLGHYAFDAVAHPFVYARSEYGDDIGYGARHATLETDLDDVLLFEKCGLKPSQHKRAKIHFLSYKENRVIRKIFRRAAMKTYPEIREFRDMGLFDFYVMPLTWVPLHNKTGRLKKVIQWIEKLTVGRPVVSPQVPEEEGTILEDPCNLKKEEWHNPFKEGHSDHRSYEELFEEAQIRYGKYQHALAESIVGRKRTLSIADDYSYLSGLSLEKE